MLRRRMKAAPHLVADISGHGFGHVAMTAPVLNELGRRRPELRLTVRSSAPERLLREHIDRPFDHVPVAHDFGMAMVHALEIDTAASFERYRALHARWSATVAAAAGVLRELQPTLLLANVPYLSLAAAHEIGVPGAALCCLNWADIVEHYCGGLAGAEAITRQTRSAYALANVFLAPDPSMPMPGLHNRHRIGPIGRRGCDRRADLNRRLGLNADTRLVLLSLGGVPFSIDIARWPRLEGVHVLAAMQLAGSHPDVTDAETLALSHIDLLASCDAVVTKPGYGTVTEAAVNGKPMLYVSRDGWPEEPYLVEWLRRTGCCAAMPQAALIDGMIASPLEALLNQPRPAPVQPSGIGDAVRVLLDLL